ncbi:peptide ABC transporter substrate-binding protein [Brevibacillus laterosporus]|uniref:peptide ABC transporter substrate-binding protein n=1 Tax=Brevibacillus laterosporus TaxID=1465 RepID=UPI000CE537B2|nr:peptide ABC transporter substrate-binding protein [Brevibacillus laterosporus]AYB40117.1 peptide ABC transporter substrate-binding protein [Brevibacillus laterosporus]MBG9773732.1 ABC transporter substrate-binding protein [Brevibacillus laterosporus]MBG9797318.1 ABC transporter substrate-binding protein [Brevibacillus laterosporus]MBM7111006.1 Oligopeptide-binding protein OppA precursor [Brevibacillus laterosporus]MCR8939546.1 peptide ABC transporter substrate-binding protein [Brevibacillus
MNKSIFTAVSSILVLSTALAGCGGGTASENKTGAASGTTHEQVLRVNLHSEPPTADPGLADDNASSAILRATFDGLMRSDKDGKVANSVAKDYKVSEDGKTYTFTLRDSLWANGEKLTAKDFEYAWKRVLNPKTAASYAYQLYYLKNAEAYNKGQAKAEDVGVKALDEHTLEVTLNNPTPFFLELTAFYTLYPVNEKVVASSDKWAGEASTHIGNGPFKMESWKHKNEIVLVKNDNYWDKDNVKLEKIIYQMIDDENTELSMFENGDLDWAGQPNGMLPIDAIAPNMASGKAHVQPKAGIYWYKFNTEKAPFNNAKIRKAFAYAIDRKTITDNITQSGQTPATNLLPPTMALAKEGFFKDGDVDTAKKLLAEGMKEEGLTKLPPIEISFNTAEKHKKIAEAIQDQWKKAFDIDVKLTNKEWKVFIDDLHRGNYQVGRNGWNADYNDPISFLQIYKDKTGGNNDTKWENPKYKELLNKADAETNPEVRKGYLADAEKIIIDEMPIIPIYFDSNVWLQNDNLKGVVVDAMGNVDYKWTSFE